MVTDLILGTAGHIDHGKTALIKAITGVNTDRLPEERKRGITIELGFAELVLGDLRLGIVDVPGHERFVRNMLAGATGTDIALLVVAADDSVKPQTREHLEILRLLNLHCGVIALTKCDAVEPAWIELVEAEVRELVSGTFLATAPVVWTSAHRRTGLDALRKALAAAAQQVASTIHRRQRSGPFRLAIDRTFTIAGHGTVVTGSVLSGQVEVGDSLVIQPGGLAVRVRGLQHHDRQTSRLHRGQRAAINLAGVHHDQIKRGQEISSRGHLIPSTLITTRLHLSPLTKRSLKNRARVHLHLGTDELMASVRLLDTERLLPGESAYAQLYLSHAAVATWNQPFIIRSESPTMTIGGGIVLDPKAEKIRPVAVPESIIHVATLTSEDPLQRASATLYLSGWRDWQPDQLMRTAGIQNGHQEILHQLRNLRDLQEIRVSPTRKMYVHRLVLEKTIPQIERALKQLHRRHPLQRRLDTAPLIRRFAYLGPTSVVNEILKRMADAGKIELSTGGIVLTGHGPQLSSGQKFLLKEIIKTFHAARFHPPSIDELKDLTSKNQAILSKLVDLAVSDGDLLRISDKVLLHQEHEKWLRQTLTTRLTDGEGLTLSQIRELLQTSRKYTVPICEYLDRVGFTRREGDLRVLAKEKNTNPT